MVSCHFVEVPTTWQGLDRPFSFIPTAAKYPFPRRSIGNSRLKALTEFGERLYSRHIYGEFLESGFGKVQMSIVEARHHKATTQINHLCLHTFESEYFFILADRLNAVSADGDRLGTRRYSK